MQQDNQNTTAAQVLAPSAPRRQPRRRKSHSRQPALTARQLQAYRAIQRHYQREGAWPSQADVRRALGLSSSNSAWKLCRALQRLGLIKVLPRQPYGIRLTDRRL